MLGFLHTRLVHRRRVRKLAQHLSSLCPKNASVLDVGSGDGKLASCIKETRPDINLRGVDVLVREKTAIPVDPFDGKKLPYADKSFDFVLFVDVLHHTDDPYVLLKEAARVARQGILIKDHTADGFLGVATLRVMDHVGNARHGVALPYNYWRLEQWNFAFFSLGLKPKTWISSLHLYPFFARWLFERKLHFVTLLEHRPASNRV